MESITGLGIMSGSSLDGVDLAICTIHFNVTNLQELSWEFIKTETVPIPETLKKQILHFNDLNGIDLLKLHHQFGRWLGEIINEFKWNISIDFIASHGHTLYHSPKDSYSIQIGDGGQLSSTTGLPVICDFRNGDMALGGQGAPIAPLADSFLLGEADFYMNLGGIANITHIQNEKVIAFDICACNQILNPFAMELGVPYDDEGSLARQGSIHEALLNNILKIDFHSQKPPKSLDNSWVNENVLSLFDNYTIDAKDKLRTAVESITILITQSMKEFIQDEQAQKLIACGGGANNSFLMERLAFQFEKENLNIEIQKVPKQLIEFKEAALMTLLGLFRILGKKNIYSSVTGAKYDICGGAIYDSFNKLKYIG
ncbi:MAG: anhydro-N-acetylmuramic acid kinase [Bacteroidota bacterium]